MSCDKKNTSTMNPVVRVAGALWLVLAALCAAPAAFAVDAGDIVVVSLKGEVHFTMNGAARTVRAGGVLEPPAVLRTGRDGAVELRQGATTLSVGPETLLEFPAAEKRGAPIDRILQPTGNVFYDIGKREGRKLRIETPYLVGVVKGTQFNVAAQDESTTISLFEGQLEVRAIDDSGAVDLRAGEIASRERGGHGVNVIRMDALKVPRTALRPPAGSEPGRAGSNETSNDLSESVFVDRHIGSDHSPFRPADTQDAPDSPVGASPPTGESIGVDVIAGAQPDAGPASVDSGSSVSVDGGVVVGASAPQVSVDVGSSVAADAVADTVNPGLEIAGAVPDPGADLEVDLGLEVDDGNRGHGNDSDFVDSDNPGNAPDNRGPGNTDVGELLDGLLRRPGRK